MPLSPRAAGLAPRVTGDGRYGKSGIAAQGHLIHGMAISQSSPAVTLSGHPRQLAWKMRTINPAPRVIDYAVASGANVRPWSSSTRHRSVPPTFGERSVHEAR